MKQPVDIYSHVDHCALIRIKCVIYTDILCAGKAVPTVATIIYSPSHVWWSGPTPEGLTGHKEWTLRNCRGERISQSATVHSLQQNTQGLAGNNYLDSSLNDLLPCRQGLEIVSKVKDGITIGRYNNTEVAGPPHPHPPTHTHSPGISSGVAGELSTPGLDCTERVGDTEGSGLSTGERN